MSERNTATMFVVLAIWAVQIALPARAAFEFPIEIAQPIVTEEGIFVSTVTFVKYYGSTQPGFLVRWVGAESCVIDELGKTASRNVAYLMGIQTGTTYLQAHDKDWSDTLRVFIDLAAVGDKSPPRGWSVKGAVEATVECVLKTAYDSRWGWDEKTKQRVPARYVQLDVRGRPEYAHYGGVFTFERLGTLPRKRDFD